MITCCTLAVALLVRFSAVFFDLLFSSPLRAEAEGKRNRACLSWLCRHDQKNQIRPDDCETDTSAGKLKRVAENLTYLVLIESQLTCFEELDVFLQAHQIIKNL